jgi:arylsulfatase A-like enzyme
MIMYQFPTTTQTGCRREFRRRLLNRLATLAISALAMAFLQMPCSKARSAEAVSRPNIVLIMADDLGFSDLGCYGSEIETPNLDALAAKGLRFSQFYNTAKCHSSRVSLLTGLYCDQAGGASLSRGATIAEVMTRAGYSTSMVGKWHLSKQPTDFGFERYWGHLSGATNFFTGDDTFRLNGEPWSVPKMLNGRPFYTTHAITDFALDFLDKVSASEKPFLLYTAFNAPHYPLQAPRKDIAKYDGRYDAGWDALRKSRHQKQLDSGLLSRKWKLSPRPDHIPAWKSLTDEERAWEADRMEVFAAMVDVLDQNVGRLVKHLKDKGVYDNTLILFCSDNGACPFERTRGKNLKPWDPKSYWTYDASWAHAGNTPFRLYKQNQHEGGISSPMIAHWPNGLKTKPGSVTDQPGHLVDFMATFIEMAGADYPSEIGNRKVDPLQGKSLLPIFRGETQDPHEQLYFHFSSDRALRQGPWKLVSAKLGKWELYNLDEDRTELNDLAEKHPERVAEMSAEWFRVAKDVERLGGKGLAPVGNKVKELNFRGSPAPGFSKKRTKKE